MKSKSLTKGKKVKTPAKLKKELDAVWSRLIRSIWAVGGRLYCYTCGRAMTPSEAQCGHFIPRNILVTRWEKDNCRPQCVGCNIFGNGKILDFEEHLKKELGIDRVEEMKSSRHQVLKVDVNWYIQRIEEVKKELSTVDVF